MFFYLYFIKNTIYKILVKRIIRYSKNIFLSAQLPREEKMEKNIADLQNRLQHLESLYRARSEDILKIQVESN